MASTSYLSRVIWKEHTETSGFAGSYKLLVAAKSIPSPIKPRNNVESTTLEDGAQTFEQGIRTSEQMAVEGNLTKEYLDAMADIGDKQIDVIFLYGTTGLGDVAKIGLASQVDASPSDIGGNDEILGMTVTITPNTVPEMITDDYTVTESNGTFTVTAKA